MSLNGLDGQAIQEAYAAAVSEPGGWFLLQYASRDEISLLGRGGGGIVEMRNAISHYEEASPLYGFLRYRRRNVIVKYLPENCSRLVQARVTVHYNAVCERFTPYNTTFSIAAAKDLKDTKLSAACSLHTASSSTSSSTSSLRRRRLVEIAEEEEEEERASKRQSVVKEDHPTAPPPVTLDATIAATPGATQFAGTAEVPSFNGVERPSSPSAQYGDDRRLSSQLARPEVYSSYQYGKPKVKLAPRPSTDVSGRPRTSGSIGNQRPVSSIPAGFKLFSKGSRRGRDDNGKATGDRSAQPIEEERASEPSTSGSGIPPATALADDLRAFPVPPSPPPNALNFKRPHTSSGRPASSSGLSVKSVATTTAAVSSTRQSTMTMEKARLLKAMKMREKRRKMNTQPSLPIPTVGVVEAPAETADDQPAEDPSDSASAADVSVVGSLDDRPGSSGEVDSTSVFVPPYAVSADSATDGLPAADRVSLDTHTTDSHPASPLAMSSEIGDSTKASSLSESTDETAQPLEEDRKKNEDEDEIGDGHARSVRRAIPEDLDAVSDDRPAKVLAVDENPTAGKEEASKIDGNNSNDMEEQPPSPVTVTLGDSLEKPKLEPVPGPESESQSPDLDEVAGGHVVATSTDDNEGSLSSQTTETPAEAVSETTADAIASTCPATSAMADSEASTADVKRAATTPPNVAPSITLPDRTRDSQFTTGQDNSDTASVDTKRARRRALVDPIRTDFGIAPSKDEATSETRLSDDESLVEELLSASVEEAKPITVSKSPVTPVLPNASPSRLGSAGYGGVRTVSNPIRGNLLVPGDVTTSSARSVSSGAVFLHKMAQQAPPQLAQKKSNIGSSISQRIKALEKLSSTAAPPAESPVRMERPTSTFFSVRRTAGRDASKSPSVVERASSTTRGNTPSPPTTQESSPEAGSRMMLPRDRSGSVASRLSVFEGGAKPRGRPESIQVRARIVRDSSQPFSKLHDHSFDPSEPSQLEFRQSHLTVDHKRAIKSSPAAPARPAETELEPVPRLSRRESIQERRMSRETRRSQSQDRSTIGDDYDGTRRQRRSSLSIVKDFIKERRNSILGGRNPSQDSLMVTSTTPPANLSTASKTSSRPPSVHTNSGLARRLSISSRRSSMSRDRDANNTPPLSTPLSPSLMTETSGSGDDSRSTRSEFSQNKTGSGSKGRTSRFMRRLSSSLSTTTRKTAPTISPTLAEEEEGFGAMPRPSRDSFAGQSNTVSYLGDVNVQFPDNLLWKRRTMFLDSQGFLILSTANGATASTAAASLAGDRATGVIKRYHLSDFRLPYIPEMEVQELPNSVCLDLIEGSGLQLACEDRAGQMNILQVLLEAHQNHTTFGQ